MSSLPFPMRFRWNHIGEIPFIGEKRVRLQRVMESFVLKGLDHEIKLKYLDGYLIIFFRPLLFLIGTLAELNYCSIVLAPIYF
jgi:hypothetical protein